MVLKKQVELFVIDRDTDSHVYAGIVGFSAHSSLRAVCSSFRSRLLQLNPPSVACASGSCTFAHLLIGSSAGPLDEPQSMSTGLFVDVSPLYDGTTRRR